MGTQKKHLAKVPPINTDMFSCRKKKKISTFYLKKKALFGAVLCESLCTCFQCSNQVLVENKKTSIPCLACVYVSILK